METVPKKLFHHKSGSNPCNGPAFYAKPTGAYNAFPSTKVSDIELLSGDQPKAGDVLCCGTCGRSFSMYAEYLFTVDQDQDHHYTETVIEMETSKNLDD